MLTARIVTYTWRTILPHRPEPPGRAADDGSTLLPARDGGGPIAAGEQGDGLPKRRRDSAMRHLSINFTGVVTDRESLLNGRRNWVIEGEQQPSSGWRLSLSFQWPVQTEHVDEGDLTLIDPVDAELYAALTGGRASEVTDEEGNVNAGNIDLAFEVTGGEGGYADATGTARVTGTIAGEGPGSGGSYASEDGRGVILTVELAIEGEDDARVWDHAPTENIPTGTPQRFQEPRG